jgi:hypothetical protein
MYEYDNFVTLPYCKSSLSPQSLTRIGEDSIVSSPCKTLHDAIQVAKLHVHYTAWCLYKTYLRNS